MIKKVEDIVMNVLKDEPRARDNDEILCVCVWYSQVRHKVHHMSLLDFFRRMSKGKYYKAESIMRCRRKLQEIHKELRGKKYEQRRKNTQNVKNELNEMAAESQGPSYSSGKLF
tara:strand:+ start:226 stop:567 length:342 start_codon:yes stop_codon:yes gene_type:complete